MDIGNGLRLHALGRVNDEQRAFACAQAARNLVRKIHMAGGINQIQFEDFAVLRLVFHRDWMRFDCDATLLFQIHGVEQLIFHLARRDRPRAMQQTVGKRRLPMIYMGDDAEIPDMRCIHLSKSREKRPVTSDEPSQVGKFLP